MGVESPSQILSDHACEQAKLSIFSSKETRLNPKASKYHHIEAKI